MPADTYLEKLDQAVLLFEAKRIDEARGLCEQLMKDWPRDPKVLSLHGIILALQGDLMSAVTPLRQAVEIAPANPVALSNYGNVLKDLGQLDLAIIQYQKAIAANPKFADAYYNLGIALTQKGQGLAAIENFNAALKYHPDWAECYMNRGNAQQASGNFDAALLDYNRVIELMPDSAQGYVNRANLSRLSRSRLDGAMKDFTRALQLDPDQPAALHSYGQLLHAMGNYSESAKVLERLNQHATPDNFFALGDWVHAKMLIADWNDLPQIDFELRVRLAKKQAVARPFGLMGSSHSELELQSCAQIFSTIKYPPSSPLVAKRANATSTKIRVGYIGGEFRTQAISILMTGIYERHDAKRFEIYAFDNGWDDGSDLRQRQKAVFKKMIDISKLGDLEAAQIIAEHQIDILIDLNGFFGLSRQGVLAWRPSPIQVVYLGCPGTMGTEYMDYLIADAAVIPAASTSCYNEKVVRMPHSYFPCDDQRKVSERVFTRAEMGLPERGFVFCCFNNNYKIVPETFSQWMRILQKVEGSVLWLFETSQASVVNLRGEAMKRGVHPDRLIFAQPLPSPEHLARHRLADLFLDTLPYNAHTTASDALWMGLPLVTQVGTTFPGRVAPSLLSALGVPELITQTPEAYEALAIELALAPAKLKAVREKIISQRATAPLFNTKLFTQHFEQALQAMYERHQSGLPPAAISLNP